MNVYYLHNFIRASLTLVDLVFNYFDSHLALVLRLACKNR